MIVVTTFEVQGYDVEEVVGLVRGNAVRTRGIGYDIMAGFRSIFGGQVRQYEQLLRDTREEATTQMIAEAEGLGADAILGTRFTTSQVGAGFAEILAYGTAVKIKPSSSWLQRVGASN